MVDFVRQGDGDPAYGAEPFLVELLDGLAGLLLRLHGVFEFLRTFEQGGDRIVEPRIDIANRDDDRFEHQNADDAFTGRSRSKLMTGGMKK